MADRSSGVDLEWYRGAAEMVLSKFERDAAYNPDAVRQIDYFAPVASIEEGEKLAEVVRSWNLDLGVFVVETPAKGPEIGFARLMVATVENVVEAARVVAIICEQFDLRPSGLQLHFDEAPDEDT